VTGLILIFFVFCLYVLFNWYVDLILLPPYSSFIPESLNVAWLVFKFIRFIADAV